MFLLMYYHTLIKMSKLVSDHTVIQSLKIVSFYVKGTTDVENEETKKANQDSLKPLLELVNLVKTLYSNKEDEALIELLSKYANNNGLLLIDPVGDSSSVLNLFLASIEIQLRFLLVLKRAKAKVLASALALQSLSQNSYLNICIWFNRLFVKYGSFFRDSPNNGHMMYFLGKLIHNEMKQSLDDLQRRSLYEAGIEQTKEQIKYVELYTQKLEEAKKKNESKERLYALTADLNKAQECLRQQQTEASQQLVEPGSVQRFIVKQIAEKIETNMIDGIVESEKTRQTKILAYNVYYYNILMSCLCFIKFKPSLNKTFDWNGTKDNLEKVIARLTDFNAREFFAQKYNVPGMKPASISETSVSLFKYLYDGKNEETIPMVVLTVLGVSTKELKDYLS